MLYSLKSFLASFGNNPLRGTLILITVTVGVATLSVTGGLSSDINRELDTALTEKGRIISIINGKVDDQGDVETQEPGRFTPEIFTVLETDYENLSDVSYVAEAWIKPIAWVGDKTYEMRSAIQTDADYAELMDLTMAAGSFFEQTDVESRRAVVVISALAAEIIYGGVDEALGREFSIAARTGVQPYTVVGVYEDVPELQREAYGIGDFIFPEATGIPIGTAIHPIQRGAILLARLSTDSLEKAASRIRTILQPLYGDDVEVTIWEGIPGGSAAAIEDGRRSVRSFALAVSILGFIILVTSTIGIFSVMLVEVLSRTRDIGLRRALGTTKAGIRVFFIGQALYYCGIGSVAGVIIGILVYRPVGQYLKPLFDSAVFRAAEVALMVPGAGPIAIAVGAAVVFGALFGFFPALTASNTPIVECIREDAA